MAGETLRGIGDYLPLRGKWLRRLLVGLALVAVAGGLAAAFCRAQPVEVDPVNLPLGTRVFSYSVFLARKGNTLSILQPPQGFGWGQFVEVRFWTFRSGDWVYMVTEFEDPDYLARQIWPR